MLEALRDWSAKRDIRRRLRKFGWTAVYIGDYAKPPTWTYSIGFDETLNQPEIAVFDVQRDVANALLWQAFDELKDGRLRFEDGAAWSDGEANAPVWRKVHPSQIAGAVGWLSLAAQRRSKRTGQRSGLEAFQLVLPDPEGHFPWDEGYDEHLRQRQPALYLPENDPYALDMIGAEREARRLMGERGWTVVPLDGPQLCWAYSIGLTETFGVPDIITFNPTGLDAADKLMAVQTHLRDGTLTLQDGLRWEGLGFEGCWRRVHESQYLGFGWFHLAKEIRRERSGEPKPVEIFQLFFPDLDGLYPWDVGCDDDMRALQPQLFQPLDLSNLP